MDDLPSTPKEWSIQAERYGVLATSVHDLLRVASASNISLEQYYSLRVLWVVHKRLPDASVFGHSREDLNYKDARDFLNDKRGSWQVYLNHIEKNPGLSSIDKIQDIGAFSNVRYCQLHVYNEYTSTAKETMTQSKFSPRHLRSATSASTLPDTTTNPPSKGKSPIRLDLDPSLDDTSHLSVDSFLPPSPITPETRQTTRPAEDEQIGLLPSFFGFKHLQCSIHASKRKVSNDGCLRRKGDIMAIVEVKSRARRDRGLEILEQEGAQMSAWIRNFPNVGGWRITKNGRRYERRLLVSQDSIEIYLTFAEFEPAYKEYVCGKPQSKIPELSFMTMNQYGPWNTLNMKHMSQLGKLLLAFTLGCHETSVNVDDDPFESEPELSPSPMNRKKAYNERGNLAETSKKPAKSGATGSSGKMEKTGKNPSSSQGPKPPTKPSLPLRSGKSRKLDKDEDPKPRWR